MKAQSSPVISHHVFISYRRETGSDIALLLQTKLKEAGYSVFLDCDSLKSGRFDEAILKHIEEASDFIIVLSKGCLERCRNSGDFVRREVAHAIQTKRNIIPYLMPDFTFPKRDLLPPEIHDLDNFQGIKHSQEFFASSFAKLCGFLDATPSPSSARQVSQEDKMPSYISRFFQLSLAGLLIFAILAIGLYYDRKNQIQNRLLSYRDQLKDEMSKVEDLVNGYSQSTQAYLTKPAPPSIEKNLQQYKQALTASIQDPNFAGFPDGLYVHKKTAAPPDIARSENHFVMNDKNQRECLSVSFRNNVWIVPSANDSPGRRGKNPVGGDASLLAVLRSASAFQETYKHEDLKRLIVWQYAALESGVMCSYPWHNSFPDNYNPVTRPWYTAARSISGLEQKPVWSVYPFASNSLRSYTCSKAVYDDAAFIGVVSVDVAMELLVKEFQSESVDRWMRNMRIYHIGIEMKGGQKRLQILWQGQDADKHTNWNEVVEDRYLFDNDTAKRDDIIHWIDRGEVNDFTAVIEGKLCFVACSAYQKGKLAVLFIVPCMDFAKW